MKYFIKTKKNFLITLPLFLTIFLIFIFCIFPYKSSVIIEDSDSKNIIKLNSGDNYKSEIKIMGESIDGIEIYNTDMSYYFYSTTEPFIMNVKLYTGDKIFYQERLTSLEQNSSMLLFDKALENYKDKTIKIEFEVEETEESIILMLNENGNIRADQISKENDFNIIFYLFGLYIIFLILFTTKVIHYEKIRFLNNKIIKILLIPIYFIINLTFAFLCLYMIYKAHYLNYIPITLLSIEVILLFIMIFIGTFIIKSNNSNIEKWFLVIAIPISCMFCALLLPNDGQDGYRHYGAIYKFATGQNISSNSVEVPDVILTKKYTINSIEQFFRILKSEYNYENTKIMKVAGYNPLVYAFSIPAILIAKLLNLHPYIGWYFGKIANMLLSIIIFYYIIKRLPKNKKIMMTYILIPGVIYQYVSLSADAMINIATFMMLTIGLDYYYNPRKIKKIDWFLIILSIIIMTTAKPIYYPFLFITIILLRKSIKKTKTDIISLIISLILPILFYLIWQKIISNPIIIEDSFNSINSISMGFKYLLTHPLQGILSFIYQVIKELDQYILNLIGWRFNWAGGNVPYTFTAFYLIILIFSALIPDNKEKNKNKLDKISLIIILLISTGVFALLLLFWMYCEVRSDIFTNTMYGLCGRYCIPIFIFILICLSNINILKNNKTQIVKYYKFLIISICFIEYLYCYKFIQLLFI